MEKIIDDTPLKFLVDRKQYNDDFYYYKLLFIVKIWSGIPLTKSDQFVVSPVFSIYIKHVISQKFKQTIELQQEHFEEQLLAINSLSVLSD